MKMFQIAAAAVLLAATQIAVPASAATASFDTVISAVQVDDQSIAGDNNEINREGGARRGRGRP